MACECLVCVCVCIRCAGGLGGVLCGLAGDGLKGVEGAASGCITGVLDTLNMEEGAAEDARLAEKCVSVHRVCVRFV